MKYKSIAMLYSLFIALNFLIFPISPQYHRYFNVSPSNSYPMEKRLNTLKDVLLCISQQDEKTYSQELLNFAKNNIYNITEDLLRENIYNYARNNEDESLILECNRFKKSLIIQTVKDEIYKTNKILNVYNSMKNFREFREFRNKQINRRLAEKNSIY